MKNLLLTLTITFSICSAANAAISGLSGSGTSTDPYLISNATDWNTLATYISSGSDPLSGSYVQLTADIDGSTITALTNFAGDLDGNNKTISGIADTTTASYQGGIINIVASTGVIHDLTVEGTLTIATTYCGGIVGSLSGTMTNVIGKVSITATAKYASAMVGYAESPIMTKCYNYGSLTSSTQYCAGIVAYDAGSTGYYTDCGNYGTIENTYSSNCWAAGLVAYCLGGTFKRCFNTGDITCGSSTTYCAGVIGYIYQQTAVVDSCYNTGNITAKQYIGGVIMRCSSSTKEATYSTTTVTITNCWNTGDITATGGIYCAGVICDYRANNCTITGCWNSGTITGWGNMGGISGYYNGTGYEAYPTVISDCYNTGTILGTKYNIGGLFGYVRDYTTVKNCYNTGAVTGSTYGVGGLAGYLAQNAYITDCYNIGDVTGGGASIGGIAGIGITSATLNYGINNCFNIGNVTTTDSASTSATPTASAVGYGVGGILGTAKLGAPVTNCYNAGNVVGGIYVAGITGYTSDAGSVTNCYSIGTVSATQTPGNISGNSAVPLSGTYYLTANAVSGAVDSATGLCYAELGSIELPDSVWTNGDSYTYPRLTSLDNDYAKAHAAAVIPADSTDVYSAMTGVFYLGAPDGVTWAADNSVISYDDQMG